MNILVIGRTIPEKKTGMMGTFEFEQSVAISNIDNNVAYAFCDLRSIKWSRKFGFVNYEREKVNVYGCFLPIGGIPSKLISQYRSHAFIKLLKRMISKQGLPDVIHIHFPLLTINEKIWCYLIDLKVPIVVTEHWSKVQTKEIMPKKAELLKRIVEESKRFICVGSNLKQSVIELTKTRKDIEVIPNMVSSIFSYDENKDENNQFEFIMVGRLVESKRIDWLIRAYTKSFANNENVHLTIVGDGMMFKRLNKMIEEANMGSRISMEGFLGREKTAEAIKRSNVYVSASILETFGVPAIEAMSCGKPVIVADNSPIKQYISKERGLLFKVDSLESLSDTMTEMYEHPLGAKSKEIADFVKGHFSKKVIVDKLHEIYSSCINKEVNKG